MSEVYSCPHCRTQNFATRERLRKIAARPLKCWKCGREIKGSLGQLGHRNRKRGAGKR